MIKKLNNAPVAIKQAINGGFEAIRRRLNFRGDGLIVVNSSDAGTNLRLDVKALQRQLIRGGGSAQVFGEIMQSVSYEDEISEYVVKLSTDTAPDWSAGTYGTGEGGNGITTVWNDNDRWTMNTPSGTTTEEPTGTPTDWTKSNTTVYNLSVGETVPDWRQYVPRLIAGKSYPLTQIEGEYYFAQTFNFVGVTTVQTIGTIDGNAKNQIASLITMFDGGWSV